MGRHGVAANSMEEMTEEKQFFALVPVQDVFNAKKPHIRVSATNPV